MFKEIMNKLCMFIHSYKFMFLVLGIIWLSAWTANAVLGYKFDLNQLRDLGLFILGKYGVDSGLNTKVGEKL